MNPTLTEKIYAFLLRLYPSNFRADYEAEMKSVFWQATHDTGTPRTAWKLLLRELRDLPGSLVYAYQDNESQDMMQPTGLKFLQGSVPEASVSWRQAWLPALAGAWLFILLGPLTVALAYPYPPPVWHDKYYIHEVLAIVILVTLSTGVMLGIRSKFPRWSFPYMATLVIISGLPLPLYISKILFPQVDNLPGSGIFLFVAMAFSWFVSLVIIILLVRYWHPMKPLAPRLHSDWTQLSFGLFILMAWLFGQIDHDEDPFLTAAVILPAIFLALGALGYMCSRWRYQQWLSLVGSLAAATLVRVTTGGWFYAVYALPLVIWIFLPTLLLMRDQPPPRIAGY
jgi:hypothetical protein